MTATVIERVRCAACLAIQRRIVSLPRLAALIGSDPFTLYVQLDAESPHVMTMQTAAAIVEALDLPASLLFSTAELRHWIEPRSVAA
jgi:hypothetical protein